MEKPFEIAGLAEELKAQGLELAEQGAAVAAKAVLNWVEASVKLTENKFDDFFVMVRPMVEPELSKYIDKIDKQVG